MAINNSCSSDVFESAQRRPVAPLRRWSPRATLGFIVVTCGGFWVAVAVGIGRFLHA